MDKFNIYEHNNTVKGKFQIRISNLFESAHYLYNYYPDGRDEELHGHSWEAELFIESDSLINGISVDFLEIRQNFDSLIKSLDHICINEFKPFDKINPTAENIAFFIYEQIKIFVPEHARIIESRVWEGPKNWASYKR